MFTSPALWCPNVDVIGQIVHVLYGGEAHREYGDCPLTWCEAIDTEERVLMLIVCLKFATGIAESAYVVVDYGVVSLMMELKALMSVSWRLHTMRCRVRDEKSHFRGGRTRA